MNMILTMTKTHRDRHFQSIDCYYLKGQMEPVHLGGIAMLITMMLNIMGRNNYDDENYDDNVNDVITTTKMTATSAARISLLNT